jgi:hypothetical protein
MLAQTHSAVCQANRSAKRGKAKTDLLCCGAKMAYLLV